MLSRTIRHLGRTTLPNIPSMPLCAAASNELIPPPSALNAQVIRFEDSDGNQSIGVYSKSSQDIAHPIRRDENGKMRVLDEEIKVGAVLAPVVPENLWCIGLNYRDHAAETGREVPRSPVSFLKATSSISGDGGLIVIPHCARGEVDYEGELAVVIGSRCYNVGPEEALDHVLGYTIANDISARRWQGKKGGGQWARGKSFDSFTPLGPCIVPKELVPDPQNLRIRTKLNDQIVQDSSTANMIFPIQEIISYLSQGTSLLPGTVILTGTPAGVGYTREPPLYLKKGDTVSVSIDYLGTLTSHVAQEEEWGGVSLN